MVDRVLIFDTKFPGANVETRTLSETDAAVDTARPESTDEVVELAADVDVVMSQSVNFDRDTLQALDHLEAIGVYGVGTDGIDLTAATEAGIRIINVPAYGADEVSTHALALILACVRKVVPYDRQVKGGEWDWREGTPLFRTGTMTLGLVGYGTIARKLARKCRPIFEEIVAYDPYIEKFGASVREVEFDELLTAADVVSIHAPLTDETAGLFGSAEFERMPDTAVLVNVARGSIVDLDALSTALSTGAIRSAGLDVFPSEPPDVHPIFDLDMLVCSPHVAWYSETSERELRRSLARDVARLTRGDTPENIVNEQAAE